MYIEQQLRLHSVKAKGAAWGREPRLFGFARKSLEQGMDDVQWTEVKAIWT